MATFTGTAADETITPSTVSGTVTRNPLGRLPSAANDTINGNGGTDTLDGGSGNDTIFGGTGNDAISAGDGSNVIDGGDGDDSIFSGAGGDTITGGLGNDYIDAGAGADKVNTGAGDDVIYLSTGLVSVVGGAGMDMVTITGTSGNTINLTTAGIEWISCGSGSDRIDGTGQTAALTLYGNLGDDQLKGGTVGDVILTGEGSNVAWGNGGDDIIRSGTGRDTIFGGGGNDVINGGDGDNFLDGEDGDDRISGGVGADFIVGGLGTDYIDAGLGTDTISYFRAPMIAIVDLSLVTPQNTIGGGTDTLLNFENVIGSSFDDQLTGTVGDNVLNGEEGSDRVSYGNATAGVAVNLGLVGPQNTGGAGTDTLVSVEGLMGSNFNDSLIGDGGTNVMYGMDGDDVLSGLGGGDLFSGGNGNDMLNGGDGNDSLIGDAGNDILNGGAGLDTASYGDATAGVTVNLSIGTAQNTGGAGIDTLVLRTIEELGGSMYSDVLTGDGGDNVLIGLAGDDQLNGGDGNDLLLDAVGDDILNGGAGQDTVSYGGAISGPVTGVVVDLTIEGEQNTVGAGIDTLLSIENLGGSDFNDILTGDGADNRLSGWYGNDVLSGGGGKDTLIGGDGDDQLNGGTGTDTAFYADRIAGVTVNLTLLGAQNTLGAGFDTLVGIENLIGSTSNDVLTGDSGNNVIEGLAGDDVLTGGSGTDTASYTMTVAGVIVNLGLVGIQNTMGAGLDSLVGIEDLLGSNFNDILTGNNGNNVLEGGGGNDLLDGRGGSDTVSYRTAGIGVMSDLTLVGAQNTVGAGFDTLVNMENLTGSNFNDVLTGDSGNNVLEGLTGNDVLNGGGGTDTASYANATAGIAVNLSLTTAQNTIGAGMDTLSSFENLTGSNFHDTVTGTSGNNVLNGSVGTDTVSYANATAGVTVNLGLSSAQNTIGAGTDTLLNVEKLTGSNFNDILIGNTGTNALVGGLGSDQLNGGAGVDTLTGNGGLDRFIFNTTLNATTNKDSITDFNIVDDTLVLENAIFTKFTATGALPAGTFVSGAGAVAADSNDYLLYNTTTGTLSYDADGSGAGVAVAFVTLVGNPALTAADCTII
jgi:Ca2+-binding RTX toxin-like protein